MLKKNKAVIIFTTCITLSPMLLGILLWNRLPSQIATHFDISGTPDNWSSKLFAVLGLPCFLTAVHLLCTLVTAADPRRQNISDKIFHLVLWICPLCSWLVNGFIYLYALDIQANVSLWATVFVSALFIIIGNYLPKCRQNYTVGIKLPWTLASEENWNHTHRFAGWLWIISGAALLLISLTGRMRTGGFIALILAAVLLPTAYSFLYHLRHPAEH